jgi:hypothetical protein
MRLVLLAVVLLAAPVLYAQQPGATDPVADGATPRRAPLALPDDLQPAVDVGRLVPSAPRAPSAPAAPAAPRTGNPTSSIDTLDLGTTSITGNQELPKVLYIVPWKRSDLGDLLGRPVNTLLDEVLAPVDPEVFERQLRFYESLYGKSLED